MSPNAPVLLEIAVFGHLMHSFVDVDAQNATVSSPNIALDYYMLQYNQPTSPNAPVLSANAEFGHLYNTLV